MTLYTSSPRARDALAWRDDPVWGVRVKPVVVYGERVLYALQPKQLRAYQTTPLVPNAPGIAQPTRIGYGGAAGGGKSHLARSLLAATAMQWKGSTSIIFRRTLPELHKNHIVKFKQEVPEDLGLWDWNGRYRELTWFNGSRTIFGYLKNPGDEYGYQGDEYDLMIFEEATHYHWSAVSWLIGNRLRSSTEGTTPFAVFPTNPGNVGHFWFKRLFVERRYDPAQNEREEDHAFIQAFLEDNQILERRDPEYRRKLETLPSPYKEWMMDGDFSAGAGMALNELNRQRHLVKPFEVPKHWPWFGGFDWGYEHPWVFGIYAVNEDGRVYKVDTIYGRRQVMAQIIQDIRDVCKARDYPLEKLNYIAADRIIFSKRGREVGYDGPTYAEQMIEAGLPVTEANNDRIRGLQRMREFVAWRGRGEAEGEDGDPAFVLMDTPGNQRCFEGLEQMVTDPDRPEDVLKVDADEFGFGGDDHYDETRYALASRPAPAESVGLNREVRAFEREVLEREAREGRTVKDVPVRDRRNLEHPEFGGRY